MRVGMANSRKGSASRCPPSAASLRAMSPQARLCKAFELSAFTRALLRAGLARRFPGSSATELDRLVRDRLEKCHNRNY